MKFATIFAIFALLFISMAMSEPLEEPMAAGFRHGAGVDGDGSTKYPHGHGEGRHRRSTTTAASR